HVSPTGVQPWVWINDTGYNYDTAGENLAKNYPSTQATVDAWMASPVHRANITVVVLSFDSEDNKSTTMSRWRM
ncbi:MAG: CAP domain-containing protein, partial [Microcoleus sp.]